MNKFETGFSNVGMIINSRINSVGLNLEQIINEITPINNSIRFILVVDGKGNVIRSKILTKSFLVRENQAMALGADMIFLKRLLSLYDEIIGENTFVHLIREKVHVLIFYVNDMIFLASCDRTATREEIADIADEIEKAIKKYPV